MHWRRKWQPTPVFLPGESQGEGSLVGCRLWGRTESGMTERLHFHFSLSCIGEGNGNPLQCSCLENPRDGRACWAAVYGVAQSRTRLKRLSSSSSPSSRVRQIKDAILSDWHPKPSCHSTLYILRDALELFFFLKPRLSLGGRRNDTETLSWQKS